ncbi:LPS assembly protein LptD [Rhodobacteraceae bacterium 2CG4]|uniref:LPS-assembly protein LptD n=1 Tax=Halovulum marinum TaxID=2662447 RepID=A0A6L5Z061_9RHOB|nr:LPS assembly protein LptD [Halovulum marinum]MSU89878.1 LPS assembly protein LptD [Halovulum marinum]
MLRLWLTVLLLALLTTRPLLAQETVALFADDITYRTATGQLVAEGNVEVYYQGNRLSAERIFYDAAAETVRAEGTIRLEGPDGVVILADLVELSTDFRTGLVQGARLIFQQQFQIASVEGARTGGRYNTLYKTVASSCSVCAGAPVPIWRIRARRVVHDEQAQRIYFENAWFDVFGLPVFYAPRLRIPAPGVDRAAGVLPPVATTSDFSGFGLKLPYYFPLGRHSDLTLTPFATTTGATILEAEYRRRFESGALRLAGAYALYDGNGVSNRAFVLAEGAFALPRGFRADLRLHRATDRSFLGQFGYSDRDRLLSYGSINRVRRRDLFDLRIEGYQTLREGEPQSEIPIMLPKLDYRRIWTVGSSVFGADAGVLGVVREAGRDVARLDLGADWNGDLTLDNGVLVAGFADVEGVVYQVGDDADFPGTRSRLTPLVGAELRWPLARTTAGATHVIEPVVQAVYSRALGESDVPNEDSVSPELDETNLFALNRFPGIDRRESGLRLNLGVNYTRIDPSGWTVGATLGRVLRTESNDEFPEGSGLRGYSSDFVAAASLALPSGFSVTGRSLFDSALEFKRAEMELDYASRRFDVNASYTFLAGDSADPVLGSVTERQEIAIGSRYRVRPNWDVRGEWRYDLADSRSIFAGGGLAFGNECVEAELTVSRRFTSVNDVPEDTRVSLQVNLVGLSGDRGTEDWPAQRCRGI